MLQVLRLSVMNHYQLENLATNPIRTTSGSHVIRVSHPNLVCMAHQTMLQLQD